MSWFEDFKLVEGGEPPEGIHTARLEKAVLLETRNGRRIKTEWRSIENGYYWDAWTGTEGKAKRFGQELVQGLGIDLRGLASEDQLNDKLMACEGQVFTVRVEEKPNGYRDTYVEDRVTYVQETMPDGGTPQKRVERPDIPIDQEPVPAKTGTGYFDDDEKIPF